VKTILVVEDDPDVVSLARRWLEREGYAVREAADGQAALAALKADPLPDLVLLDVMLPKVDGFELLRRLRAEARTRALPVVMMTSFTRDKDVQRGRELGATDYLVKPLAELDFLERVARALKGAQEAR
jgi:CheY-like chemotaxis protein